MFDQRSCACDLDLQFCSNLKLALCECISLGCKSACMTAQLARRSDLGHDANGHSLWSDSILPLPVILRFYVVSSRSMILYHRLLP